MIAAVLPSIAALASADVTADVRWKTTHCWSYEDADPAAGCSFSVHGGHGASLPTVTAIGKLFVEGQFRDGCGIASSQFSCNTITSETIRDGVCKKATATTEGSPFDSYAESEVEECVDLNEDEGESLDPEDLIPVGTDPDLPCNPVEGEHCDIEDAQSASNSVLCEVNCV